MRYFRVSANERTREKDHPCTYLSSVAFPDHRTDRPSLGAPSKYHVSEFAHGEA